MRRVNCLIVATVTTMSWAWLSLAVFAESGQGTRVTDPKQHVRTGEVRYPYRGKVQYVFKELDLQGGEVVVDIGAGDGWWSERMAKHVGEEGIIYAAEVDEEKVEKMKDKYADAPQIKPYLTETESTGLAENSCDVAFFSQVYHHLDRNTEVDYLHHLRRVVKPTGRLVVIEKYAEIATRAKSHGTQLSELVKQAEEAGWIPVRCELMTGSYHYIAIFVQRDLFPAEPEESGSSRQDRVRAESQVR